MFLRKVWYTVPYSNRKGTFFLRTIGRLLLSAIFLVLTVLLVLAAAAFGGGFLVWLVLRRVPVVKTYLI